MQSAIDRTNYGLVICIRIEKNALLFYNTFSCKKNDKLITNFDDQLKYETFLRNTYQKNKKLRGTYADRGLCH